MIYFVNIVAWIVVIAMNSKENLTVKTYSIAFEMLFFVTMFTIKCHQKEMVKRKSHNRKIIIDFEIKRTNDLLSNLVPPPVL